jgi:hypothetical protein
MAEITTYETSTYTLSQNSLTITGAGGVHGANGINSEYFILYFSPEAGYAGVISNRTEPVITNAGTIAGGTGGNATMDHFDASHNGASGGVGLVLRDGGQVDNSGSISGGQGGYSRFGTVGGSGGDGVDFTSEHYAGSLTNDGTIVGGFGNYADYGESGLGGNGVLFAGTGTLTNDGEILGGNSESLAGDGVALTAGGSITDTGFIAGGSGGVEANAGGVGVDLAAGGTLTVSGNGTVTGGGSFSSERGGTGVYLNGGTLITSAKIEGGPSGSVSGPQGYAVDFGKHDATMLVSQDATFYGGIGGFHYGDVIDLTQVSLSVVEADFNATTDTIDLGPNRTLQFFGDPKLIFSKDGHGGTWVTCACFRRGTRILTALGERAVESLTIGDEVMTASGALQRLRWIGQRHYDAAALAERAEMRPVLIRAGALGDHLPRRDLWVSPEHALYVQGALVPAGLLTNGVSILTDESAASVSYYHLEFDAHQLVFAEGAPAESFVDDDSRAMFDNAPEYALLYPDAEKKEARFCAPRVEDGEALEAVRSHLAELAGVTSARVPALRADMVARAGL